MRGARVFYMLESLLPFVWVVAVAALGLLPPGACAVLLLLPVALRNCRSMAAFRSEADAAAISTLDLFSTQLQLLFSALLALSLLLHSWLR